MTNTAYLPWDTPVSPVRVLDTETGAPIDEISARADGLPGGEDCWVQCRDTRRRCQPITVAGFTINNTPVMRVLPKARESTASIARSGVGEAGSFDLRLTPALGDVTPGSRRRRRSPDSTSNTNLATIRRTNHANKTNHGPTNYPPPNSPLTSTDVLLTPSPTAGRHSKEYKGFRGKRLRRWLALTACDIRFTDIRID